MTAKAGGKRTTFGVLIGLVNTGYYKSILTGILDFVKKHDCNLNCFATSLINSSRHWESDKNILFTLVDKSNVDGLIVITTALENYVGKDALVDFFSQYQAIPITSIGEDIPGAPSFVIDNKKGLRDLLGHLTDHHGYRRLGYITGPPMNSEAVTRFQTYRSFLDSRSLPFDPDLVVEGDFTGQSGKRAIHTLFGERKTNAEVIISANDMMAFGAIEELNNRGLQVPGDVSVAGFDDIEMSREAQLTTVRQPLYEQGYQAASALLRLLHGEKVEPVVNMPTATVIRTTCGCLSAAVTSVPAGIESAPRLSATDQMVEANQAGAAALAERLRLKFPGSGTRSNNQLEKLSGALHQSINLRRAEVFLDEWRKLLFRGTADEHDPSLLENIISELRKNAPRRSATADFTEDLFHQARILIVEALRREYAVQRIGAEIQEEYFSNIDFSLTSAATLEEQLRVIYTELPGLGIQSCYLSLFDDALDPLTGARLILAYENNARLPLPERGIVFPARKLIPPSLSPAGRRHNFVIKTLEHRENKLGFILMELGDSVQFAGIFDYLCPKLSSVLQLALFIEKTVNQARELNRANKHLEESNRALEEFATMASHDLQEPLRKILTFGERLTGTDNNVLGEDGRDSLERMTASAFRMRKLIESLLAYSHVGTATKTFQAVDLNQIVRNVLSELKPVIEKAGARIDSAALPVVEADPAQMFQLFQNLIGNALKFQAPGAKPVIKIRSRSSDAEGKLAIIVEDNGIGIEARYFDRIFRVFQRLHGRREYEGDGIGLAICKKIMDRHGGGISVESTAGSGTRFFVSFGAGYKQACRPG